MTEEEIGLAVYQLVKYNSDKIGFEGSRDEVLGRLLKEETLILPGGLRFQNEEGAVVTPGCCCGLEKWHEWDQVIRGEPAPWLGHDPWPWVEQLGTTIRVWADERSDIFVDIERDDLISKLGDAQRDMMDFLGILEKWVDDIDPQLARSFTERFDACFSIQVVRQD